MKTCLTYLFGAATASSWWAFAMFRENDPQDYILGASILLTLFAILAAVAFVREEK